MPCQVFPFKTIFLQPLLEALSTAGFPKASLLEGGGPRSGSEGVVSPTNSNFSMELNSYPHSAITLSRRILEFSEIIPLFLLRNFPKFNSLCGTILDTGHAVRAALAMPDGLFLHDFNDIQGTETRAFPASDAPVSCMEVADALPDAIPHRVEGQGDKHLK